MIKIIDTHAHYDDEAFDNDREGLIASMLENSVDKIINMGCSIERSQRAVALAENFSQVYAAVGIHPEDCDNLPENYLEILENLAKHQKVKAIGEIGLDYHYEGFNRELQLRIFVEQLELAKKLALPVVIHARDATSDMMEILREYKPNGVLHCFSGSAETAAEVIELGLYISFTGVLTFKNAKKAINACKIVPDDRLMLETDCPYMAPEPFRGKRCDSSLTYYTAQKAAEIRETNVETLIKKCNENAVRFFNL